MKESENHRLRGPNPSLEPDFSRVEFHRNAMALLPELSDPYPGVAILVEEPGKRHIGQRSCSCAPKAKETCIHLKNADRIYSVIHRNGGIEALDQGFRSSTWYRIADVLARESTEGVDRVAVEILTRGKERYLRLKGTDGEERVTCSAQRPPGWRLVERLGHIRDGAAANRGNVIEQLQLLTLTPNERAMLQSGFISRGMARTKTFWYRLAYHGYREYGSCCTFSPSVDETTGAFRVTAESRANEPLITFTIARLSVKPLLAELKERLSNQHHLPVHPIPLKTVFNITRNTEIDVEVLPALRLLQQDGEVRFFERENLAKFTYGRLVYLPELKILAELEPPGASRKFTAPRRVTLKKNQIPGFVNSLGREAGAPEVVLSGDLAALQVQKSYDAFEISPVALDRDWCWLSVHYGIGSDTVSLEDILKARAENQRYLPISGGWVDTASHAFEFSDPAGEGAIGSDRLDEKGRLKVTRSELFRIHAMGDLPPRISGEPVLAEPLRRFLEQVPSDPLPPVLEMTSSLREYQKNGVGWLWFLYENRLGGLLCDDMGLGKTHQVMALMVALKQSGKAVGPHLVVCPTTVISHWRDKIGRHAPSLGVVVHHGGGRDAGQALSGDVLITSYGVLRRDMDRLSDSVFCLVVLDEAQSVKNAGTQAHSAVKSVRATMKIGLTGTPIENRIEDLKTLMDLVMPGYLGPDEVFRKRFVKPISDNPSHPRKSLLGRLIKPFTLRRMKTSILTELPPKIEDIRFCALSDDQVRLYRQAIDRRAGALVASLESDSSPIPYIHIFALLTLLKQICDHPELVEKSEHPDDDRYTSGKWELFKELVAEGLDSGQKIVVYSQFTGMIDIMERYLQKEGIDHVRLTGASRNRGKIVDRFNEDPECRMFLGSLLAGGVGIDLVKGSIVIHYDRWWNAAREDQATDRVHRIGQTRGVQVFKLVTEGTLEEKVGAIIDKKRKLMQTIVQEDDPNLLKLFTRQELIDILKMPGHIY